MPNPFFQVGGSSAALTRSDHGGGGTAARTSGAAHKARELLALVVIVFCSGEARWCHEPRFRRRRRQYHIGRSSRQLPRQRSRRCLRFHFQSHGSRLGPRRHPRRGVSYDRWLLIWRSRLFLSRSNRRRRARHAGTRSRACGYGGIGPPRPLLSLCRRGRRESRCHLLHTRMRPRLLVFRLPRPLNRRRPLRRRRSILQLPK